MLLVIALVWMAAPAGAAVTHKRTFGVNGTQFALDPGSDDVFTASGATVSRYNAVTGQFETSWSEPNMQPNDVAFANGRVYVATPNSSAVGTANRLYSWHGDSDGDGEQALIDSDSSARLRLPRGLGVWGPYAYVATGEGSSLVRLGLDTSIASFGFPQVRAGWGINGGETYQTCVPVVGNPCTGSAHAGQSIGHLNDPRDVEVRPSNGAVYVFERRPATGGYEYRITGLKGDISTPLSFVMDNGGVENHGSGADELNAAYGFALDEPRGRIYVADQSNNRVAVYTFGGQFLAAFGWGVDTGNAAKLEECSLQSGCQAGTAVSQLSFPQRVDVDPGNGDVYVSHTGGISVFSFVGGPVRAPKNVLLAAKSKKVKKNRTTTLTASLLPCSGTQREPVVFEKRAGSKWKALGARVSANGNCRAQRVVTIKQRTTFRARSPQTGNFKAGVSKTITVTLKR